MIWLYESLRMIYLYEAIGFGSCLASQLNFLNDRDWTAHNLMQMYMLPCPMVLRYSRFTDGLFQRLYGVPSLSWRSKGRHVRKSYSRSITLGFPSGSLRQYRFSFRANLIESSEITGLTSLLLYRPDLITYADIA